MNCNVVLLSALSPSLDKYILYLYVYAIIFNLSKNVGCINMYMYMKNVLFSYKE